MLVEEKLITRNAGLLGLKYSCNQTQTGVVELLPTIDEVES